MKHLFLLFGLLALNAGEVVASKPFTAEDMVTMKRVASPALSPDGNSVAYTLRSTDLEADKGTFDIYLTSSFDEKSKPKQITTDPATDTSPKWSADGKYLYFLSSRSGSNQLWRYTVESESIEQVSDVPVSIGTFKLSPTGGQVVFSASVYPECETLECSTEKSEAASISKQEGKLYDKSFVRHWDHWLDGTQSRLFSAKLSNSPFTDAIALSHSLNGNVPSSPFGGDEEYTISPDGKTVIFTLRIADKKEPTSTNFDLYEVSIKGGKANNLTKDNLAWDTYPVFSPDGRKLAWLAMDRPGFEADRRQLHIRDLKTGKTDNVTKEWDRSFYGFQFGKDGKQVFLYGNHIGKNVIWSYDLATKQKQQLTDAGYVSAFDVGSDKIVYQYDDLKNPADLFIMDLNGANKRQLTHVNQEVMSELEFGDYEQFSFKGWNDETVYGYIIKPADFDEEKEYPLAFLIHGGPQGSFGDHFHYRWNPQTYTGQGFVAVMIDFHGSTGYGQDFTDSITGDWGGKPLEDLQKGLAYVEENYEFVDTDNACALGASYGGYMINWIAGNWSDQFKCLVNHDGIFDNRMMYYSTEELWFVEWENGGTYFDKPENFEKHNPVHFVKNWRTPMLVVQGSKDYRVPETQSLATFTALQRQDIPSQMLIFENENHWVLKPNNSIQWHLVVNNWLHQWLTDK
ncbi:MAG TPA: S9 family peptidase [Kangiella sp.]